MAEMLDVLFYETSTSKSGMAAYTTYNIALNVAFALLNFLFYLFYQPIGGSYGALVRTKISHNVYTYVCIYTKLQNYSYIGWPTGPLAQV